MKTIDEAFAVILNDDADPDRPIREYEQFECLALEIEQHEAYRALLDDHIDYIHENDIPELTDEHLRLIIATWFMAFTTGVKIGMELEKP